MATNPSEDPMGGGDRRMLSLRNRSVAILTARDRVVEADRQSKTSSRTSERLSSNTGSTLRRRDVEELRAELEDKERRLRALELASAKSSLASRSRASASRNSEASNVSSNRRVTSWVEESRRNLNMNASGCRNISNHCGSDRIDAYRQPFNQGNNDAHTRPPRPCGGNEVSVDELKGWIARKNTTFELPTFDGDPAQWPLFISMYRQSTESGRYSDDENLVRLQKALKGNAREHVGPLLFLPGGLGRVIDRLQRRFGRPDAIAREVMAKLEHLRSMGENGLRGLDEMAAVVDNAVTTVALVGRAEYLYNPVILNILVSKLNVFLKLQWGEQVARLGDGPVSLERFNDWLQDKVEAMGNAGAWDVAVQNSQTDETSRQETEKAKSALKDDGKTRPHPVVTKCLKCKVPSHVLKDCRKFAQMEDEDRFQWAREKEICFGCLQKGHRGYACKARVSCKVCKKHHNTLLHPKNTQTVGSLQEFDRSVNGGKDDGDAGEEATSEVDETTAVSISKARRLLLRIVPVKLHGPQKTVETYAFLDSGSTVTMIQEDMAKELGIRGEKQPLKVRWTDDTVREESESQVVSFKISGIKENATTFQVYNARTIHQLNLPQQTVNPVLLGQSFDHLKDLEISAYKDAKPTILLGEDNWALAMPLKVVHRSWDGPVATKTRLGWILHGKVPIHLKETVVDEEELQLTVWTDTDNDGSTGQLDGEGLFAEGGDPPPPSERIFNRRDEEMTVGEGQGIRQPINETIRSRRGNKNLEESKDERVSKRELLRDEVAPQLLLKREVEKLCDAELEWLGKPPAGAVNEELAHLRKQKPFPAQGRRAKLYPSAGWDGRGRDTAPIPKHVRRINRRGQNTYEGNWRYRRWTWKAAEGQKPQAIYPRGWWSRENANPTQQGKDGQGHPADVEHGHGIF
uniref:CCHC-type domain-containing protein n=1 Tax=Lygus hesperus TaxID=30085 RepID=A0A0A9WZV8_LYGHE